MADKKRIPCLDKSQKTYLRSLIKMDKETSFAVACIRAEDLGRAENIILYQTSRKAEKALDRYIRKL